ncbi:MAG: hypothetical protein C0600_02045 [Ignavibacteria bacterium]|nr:MAG: hypothetical protein C0600_02045 [Ignavibacteria bacterium]
MTRGDGTMGHIVRKVLFVGIGMLIFGSAAPAQPMLNFKRVIVNWPTIELYFSVGCNGNPAYNMTKQDFRITESGEEIRDFTLWCPDPYVRCVCSLSIVADVSGSMRGTALEGAKTHIRTFIDLLDGVLDEATVIAAGTTPVILQRMTTIKPLLYAAVDNLRARGASALHNGILAGLEELRSNGVNQCRGMLVFTDGRDNASNMTAAEIISIANRNRIRIFMIGTGYTVADTEMQMIALLTGGRYYHNPNHGQLAAIYQEINAILFPGFQECVITYNRDCTDGSMRNVELKLQDFCGGSDAKSRTYRAPLDSSWFNLQRLSIGPAACENGSDVVLPLRLEAVPGDSILHAFDLMLRSVEPRRAISKIVIPDESPLAGALLETRTFGDSARVHLLSDVPVTRAGTLVEFHTGVEFVSDSTWFPFTADLREGVISCTGTTVDSGGVLVVPRLLPYIENGREVFLCPASEGTLNANEGFISYLWSTGDTTRSITVINPGEYSVSVVDRHGDTLHSEATMVVNYPERKLRIEADGALKICNGHSRLLTVVGDTAGTKVYWNESRWPTPWLRVSSSGAYWARVVDSHGCVVLTDTVHVAVTDPEVHFNHASPIWHCEGDSVELRVLQEYPKYYWSTGDTTQSITVVGNRKDWGNAYSVFVEDRSGCRSDRQWITVRTYPEHPLLLNPGGRIVVCDDARVEVSGAGEFAGWHWSTGDTSRSVTLSTPGEYVLTATDTNGCSRDTTVDVVPIESLGRPTIGLPQGRTLCADETLTLDGGEGYASWNWSTGDSARYIAVADAGQYFVDVIAYGGCTRRSDTITLRRENLPAIVISPGADTVLCPGDSIQLSAPAGYAAYFWNTQESTSSIWVTRSGTYAVTVVTAGGCENTSLPVSVWIRQDVTPWLQRRADTLFASRGVLSYQWLRDDQPLPGRTQQWLHLTETGRYAVEVIDSCGRRLRSDDLLITTLDVPFAAAETPQLHTYPEPVRDILQLRVEGVHDESYLDVYDLLGRPVLLRRPLHGNVMRVDLSSLPAGVYLLRLMHDRGTIVRRIQKK